MKKLLLALSLLVVTGIPVFAEDLSVQAHVDRNVLALNDQLNLQIEISGSSNVPDIKLPELADFTAVSSGRSSNVSFINGQMSSAVTFSYILVPKATGKFSIPSLTLQYNGKAYQTQAIPIEVTDQPPAPAGANPPAAPGEISPEEPDRGQMYVTASVDKPTVFVNEQVVYTFRFYRRVQLLSSPRYQPPNYSGFWTEDIAPRNYTTTIKGVQYAVSEVRTILFPTKPGRFTLADAALQCEVQDRRSRDPFGDDFFGGFFSRGRTEVLRAQNVGVNVLPLPDTGKPSSFNGAVGRFKVAAALDKNSTRANEAVTLALTVTGTGNVKTVSEPALPDWPDFRKYETASSLNLAAGENGASGSKTFKTVIVPLTPGTKTISPISFSFFDPAEKSYRTVATSSLTLDVKPGAPGAAAPLAVPSAAGSAPVTVVNRDINYIKTPAAFSAYRGPLYRKPFFIALNVLPLVALVFTVAFVKWREKLSTDVAFARRRRASGTARKYLKKAKELLAQGRTQEFCAALSRSLLEYSAHKLNVSPDGLTSSALSEMLGARSVPQTTIAAMKALLDECDMARFAPVDVPGDAMSGMLARSEELIGTLEKYLR